MNLFLITLILSTTLSLYLPGYTRNITVGSKNDHLDNNPDQSGNTSPDYASSPVTIPPHNLNNQDYSRGKDNYYGIGSQYEGTSPVPNYPINYNEQPEKVNEIQVDLNKVDPIGFFTFLASSANSKSLGKATRPYTLEEALEDEKFYDYHSIPIKTSYRQEITSYNDNS